MATKLDKTIKREIELDGQPYMVAISPEGVKLTQKGFRKGREMKWKSLWEGGSEEGSSSSGSGAGASSRAPTGGAAGGSSGSLTGGTAAGGAGPNTSAPSSTEH